MSSKKSQNNKKMSVIKSKDSKNLKIFDITTHKKGFVSETVTSEGSVVREYFQFREIHQVIHHPGVGVEIVQYNESRRVFYNDVAGMSQQLFDAINTAMLEWVNSNLN